MPSSRPCSAYADRQFARLGSRGSEHEIVLEGEEPADLVMRDAHAVLVPERGDHHDCVVVDRYDPLVFADQVRGLLEASEHLHELVGSEHLVVRGDGTQQRFIVVELADLRPLSRVERCGECVMEGERTRLRHGGRLYASQLRVAIGRERRSRGARGAPEPQNRRPLPPRLRTSARTRRAVAENLADPRSEWIDRERRQRGGAPQIDGQRPLPLDPQSSSLGRCGVRIKLVCSWRGARLAESPHASGERESASPHLARHLAAKLLRGWRTNSPGLRDSFAVAPRLLCTLGRGLEERRAPGDAYPA